VIIRQKWIFREDLRKNPDVIYVFGDNVVRRGMGGQAMEMRGEPNAHGVVTKWKPTTEDDAYFHDRDYDSIEKLLHVDFGNLRMRCMKDPNSIPVVVFPADGLGTGLSELPKRAPRINTLLLRMIREFEEWMKELRK
jgi:hypothetical protein